MIKQPKPIELHEELRRAVPIRSNGSRMRTLSTRLPTAVRQLHAFDWGLGDLVDIVWPPRDRQSTGGIGPWRQKPTGIQVPI